MPPVSLAVTANCAIVLGGPNMDAAIMTVGELTRPSDDYYYEDVLGRYSMVRTWYSSSRGLTVHGYA
jgi:hypothetical protein